MQRRRPQDRTFGWNASDIAAPESARRRGPSDHRLGLSKEQSVREGYDSSGEVR